MKQLTCGWTILALTGTLGFVAGQENKQPIVPEKTIKLFNGVDLKGLYVWTKQSKREDPGKVFSVEKRMIRALGEDNGYIATGKEYKDYHLSVEFKWGKKPEKAKPVPGSVRNSGILLHAVGPDGAVGGVWMSCIECQLAQGCVGDFIAIRGKDAKGEVVPVSMTTEVEIGPDKRPRWKEGGEKRKFPPSQLWWNKHEPFFKEVIDTRGKNDVDSPLGEWTRVECICAGSSITILVNGHKVNHCFDVYPSAGKILLQSEGFEVFFRNFELHPVKK